MQDHRFRMLMNASFHGKITMRHWMIWHAKLQGQMNEIRENMAESGGGTYLGPTPASILCTRKAQELMNETNCSHELQGDTDQMGGLPQSADG